MSGTLAIYGGMLETDRCGCALQAGTVRFIDIRGSHVDVKVGKSGRFSLRLPPGRYTVRAGLRPPMQWPMGSCASLFGGGHYDRRTHASYIVLRTGERLHVRVACIAG